MNDIKPGPLSKRRFNVPPGVAALIGVASGWALGVVIAFPSFRDLSSNLLLITGLFGGMMGYTLWLLYDPVWSDRLLKIQGGVAILVILGLHLAFHEFLRDMGRSIGAAFFVILWGGVCAAVLFIVGGGIGMVHLLGYLASSSRESTKPVTDSPMDGVWDREMDEG